MIEGNSAFFLESPPETTGIFFQNFVFYVFAAQQGSVDYTAQIQPFLSVSLLLLHASQLSVVSPCSTRKAFIIHTKHIIIYKIYTFIPSSKDSI